MVSGKLARRAENASRPPAEAPIPTTGKTLSSVEPDAVEVTGGEERLVRFGVERFFTGQTLRSGRTQEEYGRTLS